MRRSKRRVFVPPASAPVQTQVPEPEPVFEFSLTVVYTARIKAPSARVARERLYAMFKWLHDGIGKWLVPKPHDPWLKTHWVEFPEGEDFKPALKPPSNDG
jgi:hypothetical protein